MQQLVTRLSVALAAVLAPLALFGQSVSGVVQDDAGEPLIGVTVLVAGTSTGTVTDVDGEFTVAADPGDLLRFSYIGYTSQEVVATSTRMSVTLSADGVLLDDVVVVGYGQQRREAVTGAISSVNNEELTELTVSSPIEAIQGRLAGVNIINQGTPGAQPVIEIRGANSINFNAGPLIVIDGVPVGGLGDLDSRNIESITVLKDASSAAIYGSRGSGGVVLVETKRGRSREGIQVRLESTIGVQTQPQRLDLLETDDYLDYAFLFQGDSLARDLTQPIYSGTDQTFLETNTDWQDAYFQTGLITQNTVSVDGGNESSTFYGAFGYFQQEGVTVGVPFERYNFRLNSEHDLGAGFSVGQTFGLIYSDREIGVQTANQYINTLRSIPYLPVENPDNIGGFSGSDPTLDVANANNPILFATLLRNTNRDYRALGTVYANYEFLNGFTLRGMYGLNAVWGSALRREPIYQSTVSRDENFISQDQSRFLSPLYQASLAYDRLIGDHSVNAIVVAENQRFNTRIINLSGEFSTNTPQSTIVGANNLIGESTLTERDVQSLLGRVNYGYKGRYQVSASVRRDGNSALAAGNNEQTFFGGAVAWRLSEEAFMSQSPFSELKLRASYGELGNDYTDLYGDQLRVRQVTNAFTSDVSAQQNIARVEEAANRDLSWEVTEMFNIGLDAGFLNNRLNFSAEYYQLDVGNLITVVPLPRSTGLPGIPANIGSLQNTGFELQCQYLSDPTKDFTWDASFNISRVENEVTSLVEPDTEYLRGNLGDFTGDQNSTITRVGEPIGSFYGWIVDGIIQSEAELLTIPTQQDDTEVGDFRFRDINGRDDEGNLTGMPDGQINGDDRTIIGSYQPDFLYGARFAARYRGFDLSVFVQGSQGNDLYNGNRAALFQNDQLFNTVTERFENAWTRENPNTDVPAVTGDDDNNNQRVSSYFVEDGSYARLKNLTLGYTFGLPGIRSTSSIRVYASAQNLATITSYSGLDPEIGGGQLVRGIDASRYPQPRTFLFGTAVTF